MNEDVWEEDLILSFGGWVIGRAETGQGGGNDGQRPDLRKAFIDRQG